MAEGGIHKDSGAEVVFRGDYQMRKRAGVATSGGEYTSPQTLLTELHRNG